MCGVLVTAVVISVGSAGSSPHVRGFGSPATDPYSVRRFIPACAGFCYSVSCRRPSAGVHPRMCGVLDARSGPCATGKGSSPHVRGFAAIRRWTPWPRRFIPACAGFCTRAPGFSVVYRVHPRMCGVLFIALFMLSCMIGSSPHVRGFGAHTHTRGTMNRFIPACAGFCSRSSVPDAQGRVHPRMCGVLLPSGVASSYASGSSPHVRGFGLSPKRPRWRPRFIPACAGFCERVIYDRERDKVHPRMCGVLLHVASYCLGE